MMYGQMRRTVVNRQITDYSPIGRKEKPVQKIVERQDGRIDRKWQPEDGKR